MTSSECPEGFHKRASYITKTGKKVVAACVRSTNSSKKQTRKLVPSIKSLSRRACPPGMIERKAYARRYSTAVLQQGFKNIKRK